MKQKRFLEIVMSITVILMLTACKMLNPFDVEPPETTVPETTIPIEAVAETAEYFGVNSTASDAISIGIDRSAGAVSMMQLMAYAKDGKTDGHYTIVPKQSTEELVNDFRDKKLDIAIVSPETAAMLYNAMGQQITVLDINTYRGNSEQNKEAKPVISGVAIAQNGLMKLHRADVAVFVREHALSIQKVNTGKEYIASIMVRHGLCSTTADGLSIINSNTYRCEIGDGMRQKLNAYYASCDLSALGGAVPGESFYTGPAVVPEETTIVETETETEESTSESETESEESVSEEEEEEAQEYYPGEAPHERASQESPEEQYSVEPALPVPAEAPSPVMTDGAVGPGMGITPQVVDRRV